jgi:creatinine amidohydrolase
LKDVEMRLQDLNWMDVERYLETDDRIILITGATEQHAYLSLLTDILIPSRIALAVAEQEKVLIAPPLNFGVSPLFESFPGTISLSKATFDVVLTEIVQCLMHQGFRRFFILNGHGVNILPSQIEDMQMEGYVRVRWYDWWTGEAAQRFQEEHGISIDHANWGENFRFTRVAETPTGEKAPVNLGYIEAGENARDVIGDGCFGGAYQIDDTLMDDLFNRVVGEISASLRDFE